MKNHLFVYTPNEPRPSMKQFLCHCQKCLMFDFESCEEKSDEENISRRAEEEESEENNCELDSENLDTDTPDESPVYKVLEEFPAFISMLAMDSNHELFHIVKIVRKAIADMDLTDSYFYGHRINTGEKYFEAYYLEKIEEKKNSVRYVQLQNTICIGPKEVQHMFIDINPITLVMPKQEYVNLLQNY